MLVIVFETVSHTAEAGLELTTLSRMTLVSSSSVSCLLSTGITGVQHHIQFIGGWLWGEHPDLHGIPGRFPTDSAIAPMPGFLTLLLLSGMGLQKGGGGQNRSSLTELPHCSRPCKAKPPP